MKYIDESIGNLISLWRNLSELKGDYVECDSFSYCHVVDAQFKNRIWINDYHVEVNEELLERVKSTIRLIGSDLTFSVWSDTANAQRFSVINSGFIPVYQQYGMFYLPQQNLPTQNRIHLKKVEDIAGAAVWSELLRRNFSYLIDSEIVFKASGRMNFFVVQAEGKNVGTVILHGTGTTLGIHSLGIVSEYRKQGFAEELVRVIVNYAIANRFDLITLQATAMGVRLYEKVGFQENYVLSHYTL